MTFAVVIPAAGTGSRSGSEIPKQYVPLLGRPVLAHSIACFTALDECREIVVAIDEAWRAVAEECASGDARVSFVSGGAERQHSIAGALDRLDGRSDLVLVHDAARPCASPALITRVIEAARERGAAIPALPINETVKRVDPRGVILETVPRAELRAAQTPQAFHLGLLRAAYAYAATHGIIGTDDASLVEAYGAAVHVVEGEWGNIKITLPEDFERAEKILRERRG